jgi:hypothetical protein
VLSKVEFGGMSVVEFEKAVDIAAATQQAMYLS